MGKHLLCWLDFHTFGEWTPIPSREQGRREAQVLRGLAGAGQAPEIGIWREIVYNLELERVGIQGLGQRESPGFRPKPGFD